MNRILKVGMIALILASCSKQTLENKNEKVGSEQSPTSLFEQKLTMTNTSLTDPNAAEMFDVGTAPLNGVKNARLLLVNNVTSTTLKLSMADMFAKFAQTTRWQVKMVNGVQSTSCGATLAANGSCYVDVQLNYVTAAEDYSQPVEVNFVSGANPLRTSPTVACPTGFDVSGSSCIPHSTQIGKILFTGMKAADPIVTQVPALNVLKISTLSDTYILKPAQTLAKRFYIGNSQNPTLVTNAPAITLPTIVPPATGVISKNTCAGLTSLSPLKTCYFEVSYSYSDVTPNLSETVGFTSNSATLDTTGLSIALAVVSQPAVAPVQSASFAQVGQIADLTSLTQSERIYITNTGSTAADFLSIPVASPFYIAKTSCTMAVGVGAKCFIDIKLDPTKATNVAGVAAPIQYASSTGTIKAGAPVVAGTAISCKSGFVASGSSCIPEETLALVISSQGNITCSTINKELYCWGYNGYGQLGDGSTMDSSVPSKVNTTALMGKSFKSVSIGSYHTCGVDTAGLAYCWGQNWYGNFGTNDYNGSNTPVAVNMTGALAGKTIKSVVAQEYATCVLTNDGKVFCAGANWYGNLGNGTTNDSASFVEIDMTGVLAGKTIQKLPPIASNSLCVITSDNKPYCWGANWNGNLGNGLTDQSASPVAVDMTGALSGKTVSAISMSSSNACVIASDNKGYCWGSGYFGSNALGSSYVPTPIDITGIETKILTDITVATNSVCVLATDHNEYCTGANYYGNLGNVTSNYLNNFLPVDQSSINNVGFKKIITSGGSQESCGIDLNNQLYCWGGNNYGSSGNNSPWNSNTIPAKVADVTTITYSMSFTDQMTTCTAVNIADTTGTIIKSSIPNTCTKFIAGVASNDQVDPTACGNTITPADQTLSCSYNPNLYIKDRDCASINNGEGVPTCSGPVQVSNISGSNGCTLIVNGVDTTTPVDPTLCADMVLLTPTTKTCDALAGTKAVSIPNGNGSEIFHCDTNSTTKVFQEVSCDIGYTAAVDGHSCIVDLSNPYIPQQMSIGNSYACIIRQGQVACSGDNSQGYLGIGKTSTEVPSSEFPVPIDMSGALLGKSALTISGNCIIANDNNAYCWGINPGNGTSMATSPVKVDLGNQSVKLIASTPGNGCVVTSNNQIYCWGNNYSGSLGDGTNTDSLTPVPVVMTGVLVGKTIKQLVTGAGAFCVITEEDSRPYCWGSNSGGVLTGSKNIGVFYYDPALLPWGNNYPVDSNVPVSVALGGLLSNQNIKSLVISGAAAVVATDNKPYIYGWTNEISSPAWNENPRRLDFSAYPLDISSPEMSGLKFKKVLIGSQNYCVESTNNRVFCRGASDSYSNSVNSGQYGSDIAYSTFTEVFNSGILAGLTIKDIEMNSPDPVAACIKMSDEKVYCSGNNQSGKLGRNVSDYSKQPKEYPAAGVFSYIPQYQISCSAQICSGEVGVETINAYGCQIAVDGHPIGTADMSLCTFPVAQSCIAPAGQRQDYTYLNGQMIGWTNNYCDAGSTTRVYQSNYCFSWLGAVQVGQQCVIP